MSLARTTGAPAKVPLATKALHRALLEDAVFASLAEPVRCFTSLGAAGGRAPGRTVSRDWTVLETASVIGRCASIVTSTNSKRDQESKGEFPHRTHSVRPVGKPRITPIRWTRTCTPVHLDSGVNGG